MSERKTFRSKAIEYKTSVCVHCDDEVFIDTNMKNVDDLPQGIPVFIGGGEHMSVERTSLTARAKDYRKPRVIVKWFLGKKPRDIEQQYMCQSCAKSLYDFSE